MRNKYVAVFAAAVAITAIGVGQAVAGGITNGSGASGTVIDNSAPNVPAVVGNTNFDNVTAGCDFSGALALKKLDGVKFKGKKKGGGAILNSCAGFGVTGFSAPNFLAFNCASHLADGHIPALPETIAYKKDVAANSTIAVASGSDAGKVLHIVVTNKEGQSGSGNFTLTSALNTITITFPAQKIVLSSADPTSPICAMVVDNLEYTPS